MAEKTFDVSEIAPEKFEFAQLDDRLTDKKFDDKPIGYFHDAWIRFRKNKASVVATVIIVIIILYAFITPILVSSDMTELMDTRYAKMGPRIAFLKENFGILDGGVTSTDINEAAFIINIAIGAGAEDADDNDTSLDEGLESYYQPLNGDISDVILTYEENVWSKKLTALYTAEFDTYLKVGFVYKEVTQDEYNKILEYEEAVRAKAAEEGDETMMNFRIIYPLIDENEYYPDTSNANLWYKMTSSYVPVTVDENGRATTVSLVYEADDGTVSLDTSVVLEDNYLRDEDGNLRYWKYVGGGTTETAQKKIRVLYYNYYIYANDVDYHEAYAAHLADESEPVAVPNGHEPDYIFGTDSTGYDFAYRLAKGIQLSLLVAVCVSVINLTIGAIYGAIEGYYGGAADLIMERISDILNGLPFIVVATLFQLHLASKVGAIPSLLFAYVATGWLSMAYRVRTQFYRFKGQEYVLAARTLGASDMRIIWKHIFPNSLGTIITSCALTIPSVINSESMLSYLGIVKLNTSSSTSLGTLLSEASSIWTTYPHLMIFPALILSLLMICFNLFGNGLRDAFNPSLRGVDD